MARRSLFGADYARLSHDSVVPFAKAGDGPAVNLANAVRGGDFTLLPDVPEQTLERIIAPAKVSRDLSPARKALLK
ncbi:MAG TPA: hypothetical protein VHS80_01530 [Chthoniobacterales bacterium]|nr:hypothetical protein [Chthoniobacterales bacterium]